MAPGTDTADVAAEDDVAVDILVLADDAVAVVLFDVADDDGNDGDADVLVADVAAVGVVDALATDMTSLLLHTEAAEEEAKG